MSGRLARGLAWAGAYALAALTGLLGYLMFWGLAMPHGARNLEGTSVALLSGAALASGGLAALSLALRRRAGLPSLLGWALAAPVFALALAALAFAWTNA